MEYGKVWSSTHVSPQKLAEIQRRRKVSPKKRLPKRPFYQRLAGAVLSVFSFGQGKKELSKPVRIRRQLGSEEGEVDQRPCSASDDAERKRKHDDIESESDSEYSDDDDFYDDDDYVSEEDPDYEPSREGIADDSLEYQEGETESDVDLQEDDMSPAASRTRYQNRKTKSGSSQNEKKKGTTPKKGDIVNSKNSKQKEQAKPVKAAADSNTSPKVTSTSNSVDFPPLSHVTVNGHK
ncbi:uncharacterized protein LOC106168759 [Lingula anatina]|nr:uncharacterized protein LOC106168759 [Lingula anatina]|eukprot:XP_013403382.1 uncharacterized protein LOC106168759 [Lingula anatina]